MTPDGVPPTAQTVQPLLLFRKTLVLGALVLALTFSLLFLVRDWSAGAEKPIQARSSPVLRALLFQRGRRLDLFDMTGREVVVRSKVVESVEQIADAPHLISARAALMPTAGQARVVDLSSSYVYDALATGSQSTLLTLSRNANFTYSLTMDAGMPRLMIDFARCGNVAAVALPVAEPWYHGPSVFAPLSLPMQHAMLLSPAETSLTIIRHETFPRITLVHLIERKALALSVPSFDPDQLQFSPFFIDDQTLLFSVYDTHHWGTVTYHIPSGTYSVISENFTDRAYRSLTGDVLLAQSLYDDTLNIPFGSITLLERRRGILAQDMEALIGSRNLHRETFSLLFRDPDADRLQFKESLTTNSFNEIPDGSLRERLRTYWRDTELNLAHAVGSLQLSALRTDGSMEPVATLPFEITPPATHFRFLENAESLLRALGLPSKAIEEYRKRGADAEKAGQEYLLVDDLSY